MAVWQGLGVTQGIAIGPVFLYRLPPLVLHERRPGPAVAELARFEEALERALAEVQILHSAVPAILREMADRLLEVQRLLLEDPALVGRTRGAILEGLPAEQAWQQAMQAYLRIFSPIQDKALAAPISDLRDIGRRVLAALLGQPPMPPFSEAHRRIVVADMLSPSETLQLGQQSLLGLCLAQGTATSPVAEVARRLGLPAVVGLGQAMLKQVKAKDTLVVDGSTGLVEARPDAETLEYYRERQRLLESTRLSFDVTEPARTADGWRVDVQVDLDHPAGLLQALGRGAEGLGLVRTDFIFIGRSTVPSEEEQIEVYGELLEQVPQGPLNFCTLSVGPEETLPFPGEPEVGNALLGLRGVRLSLAYLAVFRQQLRAILQVGVGRPLTVVLPMVETLAELRAAGEWLHRAQQDLQHAGVAHVQQADLGLLLQTPMAVLNLEVLSDQVEAFFLDLDRLTEYMLACDRRNLRVAHLFRPLHPVVLRLLEQAVSTVHRQGKRLDIVGEAAGSPGSTALLLGLGVDGFCLPAEQIPGVKSLLRRLAVPEVQNLARTALKQRSAPEVETLIEEFLEGKGLG
ncbi:MAG: phosphoenolpyruvate--protein phosphotransferase [Chloroflexia bacterium]|nr:phosphoenolpyruvate--protein phosphotransferase [Chloroflexia bacterium]